MRAVDDPSFAQEWGPLIAAGFAAIAAFGSVASARQAWRTWRDSQRPQLTARLHTPTDRPVLLRVRNIGRGPAKYLVFRLAFDTHGDYGQLPPDGFLDPGQAQSVEVHVPPDVDVDKHRYVLMCMDRDSNVYGWSHTDKERRFKRRWWWRKRRDTKWMFEKLYGRGSYRDDLVPIVMEKSDRIS